MTEGLEALAAMEYPGRFIIIGQNPADDVVVFYGITGRSTPSRARRFNACSFENGRLKAIEVVPTDEKAVDTGQRDLLIYPAIIYDEHPNEVIAVSNGKQTNDLVHRLITTCSEDINLSYGLLTAVHDDWEYEPDAPNFTPRISGLVINAPDAPVSLSATLGIIRKKSEGSWANRAYFPVLASPLPPKNLLLSTYDGENRNPLPSFVGDPREVSVPWASVGAGVQAVYDSLAPKPGKDDLRVGVVGVYRTISGRIEAAILNRGEKISYVGRGKGIGFE